MGSTPLDLMLVPHPANASRVRLSIRAEAARIAADRIDVRYVMDGALGDIRFPPHAMPERADGLWRTTCFELFVKAKGEAGYREYNFAPSSRWAAYRFDAYREGMAEEVRPPALSIAKARAGEGFELSVSLALGAAHPLAAAVIWCIGLSAVIEDEAGNSGWWALNHPPGNPDFHHDDCFAAELRAAQRA